jgi:anaerobic magnesium-protoporphyrin IX monomethyl ester cyclase
MILSNINPLILFVNPSLGTQRYTDEDKLRSYLSLGTLASALRNRAFLKRFAERLGRKEIIADSEDDYPVFDIVVLNLSVKPGRQSIQEYFTDFLTQFKQTPLMVCMTATSAHLDEAEEIARTAKQMVPAALRIIGGPHVSVAAADFLNNSEFQVACIGEGVETLSEIALLVSIVGNPDFSMIEGITFKHGNGRVYSNPLRVPLLALDEYPFPSDSLELFRGLTVDLAKSQNQLIYILSGYGCPHDCIFCAQRSIHGRKIRERSAENIIEEISCLFARGFRKFAFVQETFLNRKKRIDSFCRLIEDSGMRIEWTAEARADQLDYAQLKRMRSAGLRFIQIGVESGDPVLLKKLGKGVDLDQIIQIRNWCSRLKINTAFYLLVGLPGQGWQSLLRSALFMMDHPPYNRITRHAAVSIAIPYPGTKMWQQQTVRLVDAAAAKVSWPQRNPEVVANDAGEFVGKNFTETDDLTGDEILEAWIYLDDFCHFLLHAMDPDQKASADRGKSLEYAGRMLYMIQRRAIRDLIIRAHSHYSAAKRKAAYHEIVQKDEDIEKHFKDVTISTEPALDVFMRFLAAVQFSNGFDTMKWLNIGNRIKWMKICAMLWHLKGRKINDFRFDSDDKKAGLDLDRRLQTLDESQLNRYLAQIDAGISPDSYPDISQFNKLVSAFGLGFSAVGANTLEIDLTKS